MLAGIRTRDMDVSVPPMAPSALDYDAIIRINNEIVTKWKKKHSFRRITNPLFISRGLQIPAIGDQLQLFILTTMLNSSNTFFFSKILLSCSSTFFEFSSSILPILRFSRAT